MWVRLLVEEGANGSDWERNVPRSDEIRKRYAIRV